MRGGVGWKVALTAVGASLFHSPAHGALELTPLIPLGGAGAERGVVLIRCAGETPRSVVVSRGAVLDLDLPEDRSDLVLTAAHGLPARRADVLRDCRVLGVHGHPYRIAEVFRQFADDTLEPEQDWAVLLVKRRLDGEVARLRPVHVTDDGLDRLAAQAAPVRLLLRQADVRQGDCNMHSLAPGAIESPRMLFYSCRSAPGLSGSPILASLGGRMVVIGIHLGWSLEPIDGKRLRPTSVGQPIDAQVAAAIAAAAAEARR